LVSVGVIDKKHQSMRHIEDLRFYFSLEECSIDLKNGKFHSIFYHEIPPDIQIEEEENLTERFSFFLCE
jgi:hypothetical protein